MKVVCVLGPNYSGKTTLVASQGDVVAVQPGQVIRGMMGMSLAATSDNPNRWEATEDLVNMLVYTGVKVGIHTGRDVWIDGYPRVVEQAREFAKVRDALDPGLHIKVIALTVSLDLQQWRAKARNHGVEPDLVEQARMAQSVVDCAEVISYMETITSDIEYRHTNEPPGLPDGSSWPDDSPAQVAGPEGRRGTGPRPCPGSGPGRSPGILPA